MHLERVVIVEYGPFEEIELSLVDDSGAPRPLVVIHGDGGTGKSTILEAIAHTRPGRTSPPAIARRRDGGESYVVCDWRLDAEDPQRPHPLRLTSPNVRFDGDAEKLRRREQTLFDRLAAEGPGYAFVEIPARRYFSRTTLGLNDPARTMLRYDVRTTTAAYDASRPDLTRPCKQALVYAGVSSALARNRQKQQCAAHSLGEAMHAAVSAISGLAGFTYLGLDPQCFEPVFESQGGSWMFFEQLPTQLRHLLSFVAIPLRAFWAAHHGLDPRLAAGVVTIDDFELRLGPNVYNRLLPVLRRALPRAQWILATSSPYAAAVADIDALITLRREPNSDTVCLYQAELALTH